MYYSAIGLLAAIILLIENRDIFLNLNNAFAKPAWRAYRRFLIAVLVYYLSDILWGILESSKLDKLLFVDTSLYFIAMATGVLLWTQFIVSYLDENNSFSRFLVYAGRIIGIIVIVLTIINIFHPVLFTIDAKCIYHPLSIRYFILSAQILLLILISFYAFLSIMHQPEKTGRKLKYRTLGCFGLIMAICLYAQLLFAYLPLYSIAYLLGTCLLRSLIIGDEKESYRNELKEAERLSERIAYSRLSALAGNFLCLYTVEPDTGRYREYSSSAGFDTFALEKEGDDFFKTTRDLAPRFIYPDDLNRFLTSVTKKGIFSEIKRSGIFALTYRLVIESSPVYVQFRASIIEETDGRRLIVGINDVDAQVRQEEDYANRLAQAQSQANLDALTGAWNKHAYLNAEEELDRQIIDKKNPEFAIIIMDVNDLKKVNDEQGHQAGDQLLKDAFQIIWNIFKESPVFRVGGDEFAVIARGKDYIFIDELLDKMEEHNAKARKSGGIIIACGMAKYTDEISVAHVYRLADMDMYNNKKALKVE